MQAFSYVNIVMHLFVLIMSWSCNVYIPSSPFFAMMLPEDLLSQKCLVAFVFIVRLLFSKIKQIYRNICNTAALK